MKNFLEYGISLNIQERKNFKVSIKGTGFMETRSDLKFLGQ